MELFIREAEFDLTEIKTALQYRMKYIPNNKRAKRALISGKEAVSYYEKCGLAALENDNWEASDIYFEWARIEREKINCK